MLFNVPTPDTRDTTASLISRLRRVVQYHSIAIWGVSSKRRITCTSLTMRMKWLIATVLWGGVWAQNITPPNLLFIITDEHRFDALSMVQNKLDTYKDKLKVQTPNLDRLAEQGVFFECAYCQYPLCGPSRTSLFTGSTIERTGVQTNSLTKLGRYTKDDITMEKVMNLETFEQVLVEERGYVAEQYGKWHLPYGFNYERGSKVKKQQLVKPVKENGEIVPAERVIRYNDYDLSQGVPLVDESKRLQWPSRYKRELKKLWAADGFSPQTIAEGQQADPYSGAPYTPVPYDQRYDMPPGTPHQSLSRTIGWSTLPSEYSSTALAAKMALERLKVLAEDYKTNQQPFSLTLSINSPHAPFTGSPEYQSTYQTKQDNILVPESFEDTMENSPYTTEPKLVKHSGPADVQEWTALYYGLVTEVDEYVGRLFQQLNESGVEEDTLVIFTSDHGEMLGAHGRSGKVTMYEESARIPLIMSFPSKIRPGTVVTDPVSHLDVFATILDYLGASELDQSDGLSLRRLIESNRINDDICDQGVVVVEFDERDPTGQNATIGGLSGYLANDPNFMVRKGNHKLVTSKDRNSKLLDMMFDLEEDPQEMNNLIGINGMTADDKVIGKAEHLRHLLVEWMQCHDGGPEKHYYSDNKYNGGEGEGDIEEIKNRQSWRQVDYWQSDTKIKFGRPVKPFYPGKSIFKQCEFFYIGRTTPGELQITGISVEGPANDIFRLYPEVGQVTLRQNEYLRTRICYESAEDQPVSASDAWIAINNDVNEQSVIQLQRECQAPITSDCRWSFDRSSNASAYYYAVPMPIAPGDAFTIGKEYQRDPPDADEESPKEDEPRNLKDGFDKLCCTPE